MSDPEPHLIIGSTPIVTSQVIDEFERRVARAELLDLYDHLVLNEDERVLAAHAMICSFFRGVVYGAERSMADLVESLGGIVDGIEASEVDVQVRLDTLDQIREELDNGL